MKKRPINRCLFPILLIFSFFIVELYILGESKKEMLDAADKALVEAVDIDLKNRWEISNTPCYYVENGKKKSQTWPRQITLITKKGKVHITIDTLRDLANINNIKYENIKRVQQSVLHKTNPIRLDSLQLIYEKKLKENHIYSSTALHLSYDWIKEHRLCHSGDTRLLNRPYLLKRYYIGDYSELELTTYIDISKSYILIFSLFHNLNFIIIILFIGYFVVIIYSVKIIDYIKNRAHTIKASNHNLYKLNNLVSYNIATYELKIGDESIILRQQLGLLLSVFVKSPNYEANVSEIKQIVWKNCVCTNETFSRAISCLRKYFPQKTQIRITKIDTDKYKLIIEDNTINLDEIG